MKQVSCLFLAIFLFTLSFSSIAQEGKRNTSYQLTIVFSKKQTKNQFQSLESIFKQAGIELQVVTSHQKKPLALSENWEFPSIGTHQFTAQQKELRDLYFADWPPKDNQQLYIYCVPADTQKIFAIPHKSVGFIGEDHGMLSLIQLKKILFLQFGMSPSLIDRLGSDDQLDQEQLKALQSNTFPFRTVDDYENIQTSNGRVAYYFWGENSDGTFLVDPNNPMNGIVRPFKQNHFYVYMDVTNLFFKPRFNLLGYHICLVHLISVILTLILQFLTFRRINKRMLDSRFFKRMSYRFAKIIIWSLAISSNVFAFYATEFYYSNYHMKFHEITSFHGKNQSVLQHSLENFDQFNTQETYYSKSQVFRQIHSSWYAQREDRVLYFDIKPNNQARFMFSRNVLELTTIPFRKRTQSHFVVFRYRNKGNRIIEEKVYNHMGFDLTKKLLLPDPAKRILVFVNGYRPVSTNQSMSEFLNTFQTKGVEFPNSKNHVYSIDRFDYWEPWNQFNMRFQERISADEIWYADGHHSVSTSNHGSVIKFAGTAAIYPKLCKTAKHHCFETKLPSNERVATMSLLATSPNYEGFNLRYNRGKIAARNLLQVLNEGPNYSVNDTLYIVSHSMGHAYAMGMMSVLSGKINFGDYYSLAPENPIGKSFDAKKWRNAWQYGTSRSGKTKQYPCQQDGVAPQSLVKGLPAANRIIFPKSSSSKMGFTESHFIGYYTWIFDISRGKPGYVPQN